MNNQTTASEWSSAGKVMLTCRRDQRVARMFYDTCKQLTCHECFEADLHFGHSLVSIQRGDQALSSVLDQLVTQVTQACESVTQQLCSLNQQGNEVTTLLAEQVTHIDATADEMIAAIQQMRLNAITSILRQANNKVQTATSALSKSIECRMQKEGELLSGMESVRKSLIRMRDERRVCARALELGSLGNQFDSLREDNSLTPPAPVVDLQGRKAGIASANKLLRDKFVKALALHNVHVGYSISEPDQGGSWWKSKNAIQDILIEDCGTIQMQFNETSMYTSGNLSSNIPGRHPHKSQVKPALSKSVDKILCATLHTVNEGISSTLYAVPRALSYVLSCLTVQMFQLIASKCCFA